jgi:protease II
VNDVEYDVTHRGSSFYITLRDKERPNSELLVSSVEAPATTAVLLGHRKEVKVGHSSPQPLFSPPWPTL